LPADGREDQRAQRPVVVVAAAPWPGGLVAVAKVAARKTAAATAP